MGWYVMCILVFRVLLTALQEHIFTMDYRDYFSLNDIWAAAVVVFIINACINISGIESEWYGRVPYTFDIGALFCFTVYRLCGSTLYHNIRLHVCNHKAHHKVTSPLDAQMTLARRNQEHSLRQPYDVGRFTKMTQLTEVMFKSYVVFALHYIGREPVDIR